MKVTVRHRDFYSLYHMMFGRSHPLSLLSPLYNRPGFELDIPLNNDSRPCLCRHFRDIFFWPPRLSNGRARVSTLRTSNQQKRRAPPQIIASFKFQVACDSRPSSPEDPHHRSAQSERLTSTGERRERAIAFHILQVRRFRRETPPLPQRSPCQI